ncbi:MAG TPA: sialate O-acetylesterase [Armatimonadota bacterium]|jgi:sialate O-acetylesterase
MLELPGLFHDHAVLQCDQPLPVWGTALPGCTVEVALGDRQATAITGADGRWQATLDPLPAGGPYTLTVTAGQEEFTASDILLGEVWVCSGQSNMELPLYEVRNAEMEIAAAQYPSIRLFTVPTVKTDTPLTEALGRWACCTPETARPFSAVAYCFGRELSAALGKPVGLINSSLGGTQAQMWTSRATLEAHAELRPLVEVWETGLRELAEPWQAYLHGVAAWMPEARAALNAGKPLPPYPPGDNRLNAYAQPGTLYNAMLLPLIPFAIRGVIWYQGESNTPRAEQYRTLLPALIRDWRAAWGQGDFPFLYVQLANYGPSVTEPAESPYAELREAQALTLAVPNTGMVTAVDIGEGENIHPVNKQDVGKRLSWSAQAWVYGREAPIAGPRFAGMEITGSTARIHFTHADGGLRTADGGPVRAAAIAGADRKFVNAQAVIDGDTLLISAPQVPNPVAVRYAWAENPSVNLYNHANLPAEPFRTDNWPGATAGVR